MTTVRAQQLFLAHINRALRRKHKARRVGKLSTHRRKRGFFQKTYRESRVLVEVISAVTAESFKAYMAADSLKKLHAQLSSPESRAIIEYLRKFNKKSSFSKMTESHWAHYPVLVALGRSKYPFIVDHVQFIPVTKNKKTFLAYLGSIDNLTYMEAIAVKKALLKALDSK